MMEQGHQQTMALNRQTVVSHAIQLQMRIATTIHPYPGDTDPSVIFHRFYDVIYLESDALQCCPGNVSSCHTPG